jgi:hypothetical protein
MLLFLPNPQIYMPTCDIQTHLQNYYNPPKPFTIQHLKNTAAVFSGGDKQIRKEPLTVINTRSCKSERHLLFFSLRLPIPVLGCEPKK